MIQVVVFDMDGLLIDSEGLWQRARVEAFGADRLRWTEADQHRIMGTSTRGWAQMLAERLDHAFSIDEIIEKVLDQMVRYYRVDVPLLPGARQTVEALAARYPLGLASGSSHRLINAALESAGWTGLFGEIVSTDEMAHGKPAPDVYYEIARRMDVAPGAMAVFEDSANGILAAHRAGAKVIAVPSSYLTPTADVLQQADLIVPTLLDFSPEMLAEL
ncbi:MAG: HAD family phosphatase [Chloroflexi bacterium]|mgnify:FL=1|jgi:HAD superfamily hydrolase (TIGR01509 family)|nr:HAD family phosphatase [Chloroflexota bacterium]